MNEPSYREAEGAFWKTIDRRPAESFIRLPRIGADIRVQEVGDGDPVLFIHGGINAGSTFVPMLAEFHGYRCLLVDRPGVGLSPPFPLDRPNLPRFGSHFVGDALDGLGVERAHVVASSFGGHLALRSAAFEPDRFNSLVLLSCPALVPGETLPSFLRGFRFGAVRRLVSSLPPSRVAGKVIFRQMGHTATLRSHGLPSGFWEWSESLQRHTETMKFETELLGGIVRAGNTLTLDHSFFAQVRVPTLLLWGADDRFGGADVGRRITAAMPDAHQIDLPRAGHLPWLDSPELVSELIRRYLERDEHHTIEHWMSSGAPSH